MLHRIRRLRADATKPPLSAHPPSAAPRRFCPLFTFARSGVLRPTPTHLFPECCTLQPSLAYAMFARCQDHDKLLSVDRPLGGHFALERELLFGLFRLRLRPRRLLRRLLLRLALLLLPPLTGDLRLL